MNRKFITAGIAWIVVIFINFSPANSNPPNGSVNIQAEVIPMCQISSDSQNITVNFILNPNDTDPYKEVEEKIKFRCVEMTTWTIQFDSMNEINGGYYLIHLNDPNEKIRYAIFPTVQGPSVDNDGSDDELEVTFKVRVYNGYTQTVGTYRDVVHIHISYQ